MTSVFPSGINNIIQEYCYKIPFSEELILATSRIFYRTGKHWCYNTYCVNIRYKTKIDAKFKFKTCSVPALAGSDFKKNKIWDDPVIFKGERLPGNVDSNVLIEELLFG